MRRLHPPPVVDVDAERCYVDDRRDPPPGRPWVLVNTVVSADGATAVGGVSGDLGGAADRRLFLALRALPDVILAGADTVRAERYGPPRPTDEVRRARLERGQRAVPRVAVVSGSLDLDPAAALFGDPDQRPIVLTGGGADPARRATLAEVADVIVAGAEQDTAVDMAEALGALHDLGARLVLVEGGPRLNASLLDADLIDEWCLTVDPRLAGGPSTRAVHAATEGLRPQHLDRVLTEDGVLFLRYLRNRP